MKKQWIIIAILILTWISALAQTKETFPFAQRDSTLYLDVYRPKVQRDDKAAVLAVFGGGFITGKRDDKYQVALADSLTNRGFTVINIDYRLGLKDTLMVKDNSTISKATGLFKYCIDIATVDCADAIAWVCAHAEQLDIDTSRIVLTGSSAGAITILQLDYCRANSLPLAAALPQGWKPAALIPYAGGVLCRKSNLKYATAPAPTLLMHGTKDKIVAYKKFGIPFSPKLFGSKKIDKVMDKQEIPHWFISFEGIGHEVASWFPGSVDIFVCFTELALKGRESFLEATMTDAALRPTIWTKMGLFDIYKQK